MKKIILIWLSVLTLTSCRDNNKITEVADKYTTENILPLFSDAKITNKPSSVLIYSTKILTSEERVRKLTDSDSIEDLVKALENTPYHNDSLKLKRLTLYDYEDYYDDTSTFNKLVFDYALSKMLHHNEIQTLKQLKNPNDPVYIVRTIIEYEDGLDYVDDSIIMINIILDKNFEVLNGSKASLEQQLNAIKTDSPIKELKTFFNIVKLIDDVTSY